MASERTASGSGQALLTVALLPLVLLVLPVLVSLAALDGCSAADSAGGGLVDAAADPDSGFPACAWPAVYATAAAASGAGGACYAGRAYLSCTASNGGGGEGCLSDNLTQCPGPSATGLTYSNCQDACQPDEYVLMCGSIGGGQGNPSPTSTPPAACHLSTAINPGGREPYCCPCVAGGGPADSGAPGTGVPSVAIVSQLGAGTAAGAAMCPLAMGSSWLQIGTPDTQRVTSGTTQGGQVVTVNCTVHATGAHSYSVQASALLAGQGSITITNATLSDDLTAVQTRIAGTFERGDTGDFVQNDCTFDFGHQPGDIASDPSMGIAPGRVWGNLVCPMIVDSAHNETCFAAAEVLFENCTQ
jgi:hypothetical protein